MGKGKRQRMLRQNPRAPRHISAQPPKISQKAQQLSDALDTLDNLKYHAITGEIIWPAREKEEPIPSIHYYEDQSAEESNDGDPAQA